MCLCHYFIFSKVKICAQEVSGAQSCKSSRLWSFTSPTGNIYVLLKTKIHSFVYIFYKTSLYIIWREFFQFFNREIVYLTAKREQWDLITLGFAVQGKPEYWNPWVCKGSFKKNIHKKWPIYTSPLRLLLLQNLTLFRISSF